VRGLRLTANLNRNKGCASLPSATRNGLSEKRSVLSEKIYISLQKQADLQTSIKFQYLHAVVKYISAKAQLEHKIRHIFAFFKFGEFESCGLFRINLKTNFWSLVRVLKLAIDTHMKTRVFISHKMRRSSLAYHYSIQLIFFRLMFLVTSQMANYGNSTTYRHKLTRENKYTKSSKPTNNMGRKSI